MSFVQVLILTAASRLSSNQRHASCGGRGLESLRGSRWKSKLVSLQEFVCHYTFTIKHAVILSFSRECAVCTVWVIYYSLESRCEQSYKPPRTNVFC